MTLQPGTGRFLDLRAAEMGLTARRGEIVPCIRVGHGAAVATFELIDTLPASPRRWYMRRRWWRRTPGEGLWGKRYRLRVRRRFVAQALSQALSLPRPYSSGRPVLKGTY